MLCHECLMNGEVRQAVSLCKFCYVGLCKEHLMALYSRPATVPQYACHHNPAARPSKPLRMGAKSYERRLHEEFNLEPAESAPAEQAKQVEPRP